MRQSAENTGGDIAGHGKLPTPRDAADQYLAAVDEWLWESPESANAALALVEFAGVVTGDRFLGEVLRDQVMVEERDAFHQTVALSTAAEWINRLALAEFAEQARAGEKEARS
jgi:hypothetical protein